MSGGLLEFGRHWSDLKSDAVRRESSSLSSPNRFITEFKARDLNIRINLNLRTRFIVTQDMNINCLLHDNNFEIKHGTFYNNSSRSLIILLSNKKEYHLP